MAVFAINISEQGRNCLGITLLLLNLSIAMMCLIMIGVGAALTYTFEQQKDMLQGFNYKKHTNLIIFSGGTLFIFHLIGAKVCFDSGNHETRNRFQSFIVVYMILLLVAFVLLMAVSISAATAVASLKKGFAKGFLNVMASYETDQSKRKQIDKMQMTHKCCGSTGYKDWLETPWYPDKFTRPELKGEAKGRGVPFTCCDPAYRGPCLHDAASHHQRPGYQNDGGKGFFNRGCGHLITASLRRYLKKLALWLMLPMYLELMTAVLVKYLHTSAVNSVAKGDEEGKGYGYLMEACPCTCLEFCEIDIHSIRKKKKRKR